MSPEKSGSVTSIQAPRGPKGWGLRLSMAIEFWIVTRLMTRGVGPVMKRVFRIPVCFYRIGLGGFLGERILLLTTHGRKSGCLHTTPLEYGYDPQNDTFSVMAGWGGKNDWYRNALADPKVYVWVGKRKFVGCAEKILPPFVVATMKDIARRNPNAIPMWVKLSGVSIDETEESWLTNAAYFPMLALHPQIEVLDFPL